jgi:hypothetical protein
VGTVTQALEDGGLRWRRDRDGSWELLADGEVQGRIRAGRIEVDGRVFRLEDRKGEFNVVDTGRGALVARFRVNRSGAAVFTLSDRRLRLIRQRGLVPGRWQVTEDIGGPQVLRVLKLGNQVRFRTGGAWEDRGAMIDVGLVATLVALALLPVETAAAAPTPTTV